MPQSDLIQTKTLRTLAVRAIDYIRKLIKWMPYERPQQKKSYNDLGSV
jgi:hypothetical protein